MAESRVVQNMNYLKQSSYNSAELELIRKERNSLADENRRLTAILKDGKKKDINIRQRENESLRRQL